MTHETDIPQKQTADFGPWLFVVNEGVKEIPKEGFIQRWINGQFIGKAKTNCIIRADGITSPHNWSNVIAYRFAYHPQFTYKSRNYVVKSESCIVNRTTSPDPEAFNMKLRFKFNKDGKPVDVDLVEKF